jgi:hypothetical protein
VYIFSSHYEAYSWLKDSTQSSRDVRFRVA